MHLGPDHGQPLLPKFFGWTNAGGVNLKVKFLRVFRVPSKSGGGPPPKRWRVTDDKRTVRSVLECASPLALWQNVL
jgi:hypothetical protein